MISLSALSKPPVLSPWISGIILLSIGCAGHQDLMTSVEGQEQSAGQPGRSASASSPASTGARTPPSTNRPDAPPDGSTPPIQEERIVLEPLATPAPAARQSPAEATHRPSESDASSAGLFDIPFNFDQYELRKDAVAMIEVNADVLGNRPSQNVILEGRCDEIGTADYNMILGDRRARVVKWYLERLGLPTSTITTVSYGKEQPLCTEHSADCWQRNRTVHFVLK